ncbi:uncharacterized protein AB675_6624 [Cyphellophora attinorum]|uniref:Uncharacterized protein n=1 Tax=Cyphellophora attinorum TaxID=1664694 RepID=A0A0N1P0Y9_9EURO|nr:uncharacterized protein AB675_6624 [Phialophora attinorum]KPI43994.1 hypothetical protein AB675_6624 [Phialophora attinorum]
MPRPPARRRQLSRGPTPKKHSPRQPKNVISPNSVNQILSKKPEGQRLDNSDDSDGLVTKGNGARRAASQQEVFASGAVARTDKPNAHPTRAQRRKQMQNAMSSQSKSSSPAASRPVSAAPPPKAAPVSTASAVRPPQALPVSSRTPLREDSVLNGIRPRKRQNSILRSPEFNDSTLDSSLLLPQDENSVLVLPKHASATNTPASAPQSSASKKRKLDVNDVPVVAPTSAADDQETQLPAPPKSVLKSSAKKQHRQHDLDDTTDIMAPPMSSSSEHSSPQKPPPANSKKTKSKPAPVTLTTQQLQAQLMPKRRNKQLRERKTTLKDFDIPSDTDPSSENQHEDTSFLAPSKRKSTRRATTANTSKKMQPTMRRKGPPAASTERSKATRQKKPTKSTAPPSPSPRARSPAAEDHTNTSAKSPLQQSSPVIIEVVPTADDSDIPSSPPQSTTRNVRSTRAGVRRKQLSTSSIANKRQNTGSRLQLSSHASAKGRRGGKVLSIVGGDVEADKENTPTTVEEGESDIIEVQLGRGNVSELSDDGLGLGMSDGLDEAQDDDAEITLPSPPPAKRRKGATTTTAPTRKTFGGRWAAIDDFEMDFEEVSRGSWSSDPLAR